ncbi:MAG TPA: hypothetical protein VK203_19660 [Nostocaceae cyanobacterium]|nr:hypothetical protein [Nostocaceae cyanobacterium]
MSNNLEPKPGFTKFVKNVDKDENYELKEGEYFGNPTINGKIVTGENNTNLKGVYKDVDFLEYPHSEDYHF